MGVANPRGVALEPAVQAFVEAAEILPYFFTVGPDKARRYLDELQSGRTPRPDVDDQWLLIDGGPTGHVRARLVRPAGMTGQLPVILYVHGGGWVFGNAHTHDRLVRELAAGAGAAVLFPEYDLSPEARYPVALEQAYTAARWVAAEGASVGLDAGRMAVAGDQMGGNIAAALTHLARQRRDVAFTFQVLFYPATDASFDTESNRLFGEGYSMRREQNMWFWDQYAPDHAVRAEVTASPLRARLDELAGCPPALVITAEADSLRDEGEAYAAKLRQAGVPVLGIRYQGVINGFVMLDTMRDTLASRAARRQAITSLREALHADTAALL